MARKRRQGITLHRRYFFFKAEGGIRAYKVTGVQTCALPISQWGQGTIRDREHERLGRSDRGVILLRGLWDRELRALAEGRPLTQWTIPERMELSATYRSEERRVGKEGRSRWSPYH